MALRASAIFLLKWTLIVLAYYAVIVLLLFFFGVWHRGLIVPTGLWILTVGVAGAFKGMSGRGQPVSLKAAFSVSLIAGWFVSLYTFSFVVEVIYQPLVIFIVVAARLSEKEDAMTRSVINVAYATLGLTALIPPIVGLIQQPLDRSYIESLMLPIVGLCTLLPLAYAFSLYSLYDGIGVRLRLYAGSEDVRRYALKRTFRHFHVRHGALLRFRTVAARDSSGPRRKEKWTRRSGSMVSVEGLVSGRFKRRESEGGLHSLARQDASRLVAIARRAWNGALDSNAAGTHNQPECRPGCQG